MKGNDKIVPENPQDEQKFKSFFETDEEDLWDDDLEDREVRERVKEHKAKSMKEKKRTGAESDLGPRRVQRRK